MSSTRHWPQGRDWCLCGRGGPRWQSHHRSSSSCRRCCPCRDRALPACRQGASPELAGAAIAVQHSDGEVAADKRHNGIAVIDAVFLYGRTRHTQQERGVRVLHQQLCDPLGGGSIPSARSTEEGPEPRHNNDRSYQTRNDRCGALRKSRLSPERKNLVKSIICP